MRGKVHWLSIRRLKNREFRKTINQLRTSDEGQLDIYLRLGELFKDATNKAGKQFLAIFTLYLAISSLSKNDVVSLTIGSVTASVPIAYATFVSSLMLFYFFYQCQTVISLLELKVTEGNRFNQRKFSAETFALYSGHEEFILSTPFYNDDYFLDRYGFSRALVAILTAVFTLTFVPIGYVWWYFFEKQISIFQSPRIDTFQVLLSGLGLVVLSFSATFILLMNLPIPLQKNLSGIRWGFLARIYGAAMHPLGEKWVRDAKR